MSRQQGHIGIAIVAMLLLGLVAWLAPAVLARAQVGAAYGARITCACRHVEGRTMESCAGDTEPGMWMVRITDLPQDRAVDASVPMIASRRATFRPGWGCLLEPMRR